MSTNIFTESSYENAVISLLEGLGYTHLYGPDIDRDYKNPFYMDEFENQIEAINPDTHRNAIEEAKNKILRPDAGTLVQQNKVFTDYMQNGVSVQYEDNGETKTDIIRLIDFEHPENNSFHVVNQWTVVEQENKRPDIVIFVNGIPLVVVELKSCMNEDVGIENGYNQLRNYMKIIPSLFIPNAFMIISDMYYTKAGTISADFDRFQAWKTIDGNYEETKYAQYNVLFEGMLEHTRFLDILKNFILFSADTPEDIKILAAYHQYFAVKKAVTSTMQATVFGNKVTPRLLSGGSGVTQLLAAVSEPPYGNGKGGVVWHTQGSG
jgi:type I restriction enzyme R subunit